MVRVHLRIEGRVQGVGYRYHTRAQAEKRGVSGWVRNLPDGSVEAELRGVGAEVEAMMDWCRRGPVFARVDAVHVLARTEEDGALSGEFIVRS